MALAASSLYLLEISCPQRELPQPLPGEDYMLMLLELLIKLNAQTFNLYVEIHSYHDGVQYLPVQLEMLMEYSK